MRKKEEKEEEEKREGNGRNTEILGYISDIPPGGLDLATSRQDAI